MAYLKKFYLKTEDPKDMEGIDAELSKLSLESRNLEKEIVALEEAVVTVNDILSELTATTIKHGSISTESLKFMNLGLKISAEKININLDDAITSSAPSDAPKKIGFIKKFFKKIIDMLVTAYDKARHMMGKFFKLINLKITSSEAILATALAMCLELKNKKAVVTNAEKVKVRFSNNLVYLGKCEYLDIKKGIYNTFVYTNKTVPDLIELAVNNLKRNLIIVNAEPDEVELMVRDNHKVTEKLYKDFISKPDNNLIMSGDLKIEYNEDGWSFQLVPHNKDSSAKDKKTDFKIDVLSLNDISSILSVASILLRNVKSFLPEINENGEMFKETAAIIKNFKEYANGKNIGMWYKYKAIGVVSSGANKDLRMYRTTLVKVTNHFLSVINASIILTNDCLKHYG